MAIYSPPNSFFQLNNPNHYGCVEQIPICLPVFDLNDLLNYHLFTDEFYIPSPNNICTERVEWYGYRIVNSCTKPAPVFSILSYPSDVTKYFYNQVEPNKWSLSTFDDPETDLIIANQQFNLFNESDCIYIQLIKTVRGCNEDFPEFGTPFSYTSNVVGCIGCFKKVDTKCYTTKLRYYSKESSFGFTYNGQFYINSIRLPLYLKQVQFLSKKTIFTLSNGMQKKLSARLEKEWNVETDYLPKEWHEKLVIALEHDKVFIDNENSNVNSEIMHDGNYDIDWQEFLNYPHAKAKFKIKQIPYNNVNTNCI